MLTPPPPSSSFRNATTGLSITPFRRKTSSVPLEGKDFRAIVLDAELENELDGATITETPTAPFTDNYVLYWYRRPRFTNIDTVKASDIFTTDNKPLFTNNCWSPSFIPHSLRQSTAVQVEAASTASSHHSGSNKSKNGSRTRTGRSSLRRESVTRRVAGMEEETVEGSLLPVVGAEESRVSTWLNIIIDSFTDPPVLDDTHGDSKVHGSALPPGWGGPRLTRSATKSSREVAANRRLRCWSSQYSSKPVENSHLNIKPDVVFCSQSDPNLGFTWRNAISFLELTSLPYSMHLQRNITRKVFAVFTSQPGRRFVIALSLARQEFRLHVFDRSGAIHSLGHNIHKSADVFCRLLYVLAYGRPQDLGFDPTFLDPTLSPSYIHRPLSRRVVAKIWTIRVGDQYYTIVRALFICHIIRGRGTNSWLVKNDKKVFVVKDYWTHKGRRYTEEEILAKIKGLDGVPTLVAAWTVQINGSNETTDLIRPSFLLGNTGFETRIHRRLLLTPEGQPLLDFSSLRELLSIFIDIIDVHRILVEKYCILHRDISLNNILMYICQHSWEATTSADNQKREKIINEHKYRRGLLIDFDYADMVNAEKQGVSSGHRTGTIPFMSIDILQEYATPTSSFVHTPSHDLESLIYVLVWVCVLYQAPKEVRKDRSIEQTSLKMWASAKTQTDIRGLRDLKLGQLLSVGVLSDFTPYFEQMKPAVTALYGCILHSRHPSKKPLLHANVREIFMKAFMTVKEDRCGAENAKRTWHRMQNEPVAAQTNYYSEGRSIQRKLG